MELRESQVLDNTAAITADGYSFGGGSSSAVSSNDGARVRRQGQP